MSPPGAGSLKHDETWPVSLFIDLADPIFYLVSHLLHPGASGTLALARGLNTWGLGLKEAGEMGASGGLANAGGHPWKDN